MGLGDKIGNEIKEKVGQAKEAIGDATNNAELEHDGEREQAEAKVRQVGHEAHDKVEDAKDAVGDKLNDAKRTLS